MRSTSVQVSRLAFDHHESRLIDFVAELICLQFPNLHICVTSRLEHDIQVVLEPLTLQPVTLHDERGQQQDIANYITSFVHSNETMRTWRKADKHIVIKTLSENVDGMLRVSLPAS